MTLRRTSTMFVVGWLCFAPAARADEGGGFVAIPIPVPNNETFPDPFPILNPSHPLNRNKVGDEFVFFSTQDKQMSFSHFGLGHPADVMVRPVFVDVSFLRQRLNRNFSLPFSLWSKNVFYDKTTCAWHMIASAPVAEKDWQTKARAGTNIWPKRLQTSLVHLSPDYTACSTTPLAAWRQIRSWRVDKELIGRIPTNSDTGSAVAFDYGNYAGKLVQDKPGDPLYLVYVKRLDDARTGIVAQPMLSADTVDAARPPIILLASELRLNSEYRDGTAGLQILETGNIAKIRQTWALLYTTGDYQSDTYKIGIAYSDRLTGPYQKVMAKDLNSVWRRNAGGAPGDEVVYLLQRQKPDWFNFTQSVRAPGVPSILQDTVAGQTRFFMTFAGYSASTERNEDQPYNPASRVAFFAPLAVNIPDSATAVASSGGYDRAHWVELQSPSR